ncbi:tetratricopeptide repeat protein [Chlorogloeopsis sp. ULAP01]|uniref:tetratricopeptide repeat protein n=1 Tax=Chlorogloeopsis sp. ULAP01 TaxID=3056483 RepID=UPI0025AA7ABE|nr:tetratricopeptide repeat protein [Chlorogloeopsis sp. ULAP01]MDM9385212.1 tetratricopeptide repeat protein [Chlorogloeopsis sp. ULAP01]
MQQRRIRQTPPSTFPFEIVKPNGNVLSVIFNTDCNDPVADFRIPYQMRLADRNIRRELEKNLEEFRWLLIVGRTGLGKTREAAELAQLYNREGWTILWLTSAKWIDEPTQEELEKIGANRKLLFFVDNLEQRMDSPTEAEFELAPAIVPIQERLLRVLEAYEQLCGQANIRVIATADNEKESEIPSELGKWDQFLEQCWQRFGVYELPEPENAAIVQLLSDIVCQTQIKVNEEDYPAIAQKNDGTFTNVVENLRLLRNQGLPLTSDNYIESCQSIWEKRYTNAIKKYPASQYIYDAIDLLRQFDISLERCIVERTSILMVRGNFLQQSWQRRQIHQALNYLIETQHILSPRKEQIEAKGSKVEAKEYIRPLSRLVWQLADKYPQKMLSSLFNFGWRLSILNYPKEALICFNKLISFIPEISDIWFYAGAALHNLGYYEEAFACYDKVLAIKPNDYYAWHNRGNALYFLGRYEQAVVSYDKALSFKPKSDQAWYGRGLALRNLGRCEEAVASYDKALSLKPESDQAWYSRGVAFEELKDYQQAIASYDKALSIKPNLERAWNNRGNALYFLGRYEEAAISYHKVLEIKPEDYQVWYSRSVALVDLGRYEEAVACCNQALSIKPNYEQAYYNRGNALYFLGRYEEAVASYDKALIIKPDLEQAWNNRGNALFGLGFYKEAIASCDKALSIKPNLEQAWYCRGNALYFLGSYEEAVTSYDKVLEIKLDLDEQGWYNCGNALYFLGRYQEAVISYNKVLAIKPDNEQAWNNRGNALYFLGQYEEALVSFNKAIELSPDSFGAHYNKACCYALQENVDLTLENLKEAINLNPECLEMVKTDSDFERILKDERFKTLTANG